MEFIYKDIIKTNTTNASSSSTSYSNSNTVTIPEYLKLSGQLVNLTDGIKLTGIGNNSYSTITGDSATYFLMQSGSTNNGWIFANTSSDYSLNPVAGIDATGFMSVSGIGLINDNKHIELSMTNDGYALFSGSELNSIPTIQSIISGQSQTLLINPDGGNVLINSYTNTGERLQVNGDIKADGLLLKAANGNNILISNDYGYLKANGQQIGANINRYSDITGNTFSDLDTTNSVNAYTAKKLYNDLNDLKNNFSVDQINVTGATISGDLYLYGNLFQTGATVTTHAQEIYTTNNQIILRDGAVNSLNYGEYVGFTAKKYDGTNDGQLVFDKDGWARVGDVGSLQKLATIEESPTNNYLMKYNTTTNRLEGTGLITLDTTNNRIGVNVTSPSTALHVKSTVAGVTAVFENTGDVNNAIQLTNNNTLWQISKRSTIYNNALNFYHQTSGGTWTNAVLNLNTDCSVGINTTSTNGYKLNVNGNTYTDNITALSFIKSGGTSSQFLKADGSVDNNSYVTNTGLTSSLNSYYLKSGGTLTGNVTVSTTTPKILLTSTSAGLTSGLVTEVAGDGVLLDFGVNYNQQGVVNTSKKGAFFRIDTRSAYSHELFNIKVIQANSTEYNILRLTDNGDLYVNQSINVQNGFFDSITTYENLYTNDGNLSFGDIEGNGTKYGIYNTNGYSICDYDNSISTYSYANNIIKATNTGVQIVGSIGINTSNSDTYKLKVNGDSLLIGKTVVNGNIETIGQIISMVDNGTSPITTDSATKVDNLNVDAVDGVHFWTGSQTAYNAITTKDNNTVYIII